MKSILIYGDSNTWGYIPGGNGSRYTYEDRWPGAMKKELGDGFYIIEEGLPGRTTVNDDIIEGEGRNGAAFIKPILITHSPLDLVIIMLGTNDLKKRLSKSSSDIALGVVTLVNIIRNSASGCYPNDFFGSKTPDVLVLTPPPILEVEPFKDIFEGGRDKSLDLANTYKYYGEKNNFSVLDTSEIIQVSKIDGIHLEKGDHKKLGQAVAATVQSLLNQQ